MIRPEPDWMKTASIAKMIAKLLQEKGIEIGENTVFLLLNLGEEIGPMDRAGAELVFNEQKQAEFSNQLSGAISEDKAMEVFSSTPLSVFRPKPDETGPSDP
ncbi:MAG: hypothetical protein NTW79_02460 [Candidatus Berkelbacteria bacterium]|nr:hypothetical protein [Candidatus Berkelbacteria bacterium]